MSEIARLEKEIKAIDNEKSKVYKAMQDIEEAKSLSERIQSELDNLKFLQIKLEPNQEIIEWNTFDKKLSTGKVVLILTKNGTVLMDSLVEDPATGEESFAVGKPKVDVVMWAERPKGPKKG